MAATNQVMLSEVISNNRFSAEFFDPQYIFNPAKSSTWLPIGRILKKCEYGISISMNINGQGYPIFRMNEIDNCLALRPEKYAEISRFIFEQYRLNENDILFNRTNSFEFVGRTGIIKDQTDCTFASYLIRLVPDPDIILPEFLTVFLNTPFGIGQIKRHAMRSINQANVSGAEVKRILIPIIDLREQQKVANVLNEAFNAIRNSEQLYTGAQHLLESELGLDKLNFKKPVGYTARFSELEQSRRADAEFFHTKYEPFISTVKAYNGGWSTLNLVTNRILPNFNGKREPEYYDYIEISDINISDGDYISNRLPTKLLPANAKILLGGGEILVSQVRPTRGAIAIIDDALSYPTVCSGAFYVCTVKDPSQRETIWLYLRIIRSVFEKYCGGTSYPTIESNYISKFPVPNIEKKLTQKIQNLVVQSKNAKKESQRLLDQAKNRVEQLIEEAVA